jgi:hypothetical protein
VIDVRWLSPPAFAIDDLFSSMTSQAVARMSEAKSGWAVPE